MLNFNCRQGKSASFVVRPTCLVKSAVIPYSLQVLTCIADLCSVQIAWKAQYLHLQQPLCSSLCQQKATLWLHVSLATADAITDYVTNRLSKDYLCYPQSMHPVVRRADPT